MLIPAPQTRAQNLGVDEGEENRHQSKAERSVSANGNGEESFFNEITKEKSPPEKFFNEWNDQRQANQSNREKKAIATGSDGISFQKL